MSGLVVVGVDGTQASVRAVRWAAEHAERHGAGLRLVHAREPSYSAERTARLLRVTEGVAKATAADVPVTVTTSEGSPAELIVRASAGASLVVLGHRGHGGYTGHLIGTTALTVANRGCCPMVVMPASGEAGRGPVVAGTEGTVTSDAALGFAFREAALRETDLLVVQCWTPPGFTGPPTPDAASAAVAAHLENWRERYPKVPVNHEVVRDTPGRTLLDRTENAQLVVVGSRRRAGYRGQLLRSTSQLLLHHAPCPVAVVRADHTI